MRDKSAASGDGNLRMKYDFRATRSVVAVNEVNSNVDFVLTVARDGKIIEKEL